MEIYDRNYIFVLKSWFRSKCSLHDDPGAMMNNEYHQAHVDLTAEISSFASACDAELVGGSAAPRNERQSDAAALPAPVQDDQDDDAAGPAAAAAETSDTTNNNLDDALDTAMDGITSDVTHMISNVIAFNLLPTTIESDISSDTFN